MMTFKQVLFRLCFTLLLIPSQSANAVETEYALKAGFLFNFARYSEWNNTQTKLNTFTLCSPDINFINTANSILAKHTVNNLPINAQLVSLLEPNLAQCQVLFITSNTLEQWQSSTPSNLNNIMIAGETESFIEQGGHIRFFLSGGKIRFEVSPGKLTQSGITMSSKVLRLGRVVGG